MAKKTKAADLSIEEKLEQALIVPGYEPYKIPDNWCWTSVDSIAIIKNGYAFKSKQYVNSGIRIIRITNVQDGFVEDNNPVFYPFDKQKQLKDFLLKEDDLLISLTGNVGRVALLDKQYLPAALNQRVACIRFKSADIYYKFAFYFMLQKKFSDDCFNNSKGSAQLNMSTEWLKQYSVPIPPFQEQHRIVERIESLFSKLDEGKEKAQEVIDSFEARQAAILHKAFSGELTAKWREENGVGIESWENRSINDICHSLKYGTSKKSKTQGSVIVIRMGNLQQGEIDWSDLAYTDDKEDIEKYRLYPGDVLFNRTNSAVLVGKTSIYRGEFPAIYAGYLIKLDYKHDEIIGDYLNYALNTPAAKEYCNNVKTDGVNQSNINAKKIGAFVIPVASINEQQVIVEIISSLLKKENESKQAAEVVIDQIYTMKKAILARAFRGELGTNDPEEESAVELLKQILSGE